MLSRKDDHGNHAQRRQAGGGPEVRFPPAPSGASNEERGNMSERESTSDRVDAWTYLAIWGLAVIVLAVNAPLRRRCRGART